MDFSSLQQSEDAAEYIIDLILLQGAELLIDADVDRKSRPFAVSCVLGLLLNSLEGIYVRHDKGDAFNWSETVEPGTVSVDPWIRSAVPVRKKLKYSQVPSIPSQRRLKYSRMPTFETESKKPPSKFYPEPVIEVQAEISEEETLLREKKEWEMARKRKHNERLRQIKQEEEELKEIQDKEEEELKQKEYTYDLLGNILIMKLPNHAKLPPIELVPEFKSPENLKVSVNREIPETTRVKKLPTIEKPHIRNVVDPQPPIIEYISLSPGVNIRQGNHYRYSSLSTSKNTMSRQEYMSLAKRKAKSPSSVFSQYQELDNIQQQVITEDREKHKEVEKERNANAFDSIRDYEDLPEFIKTDQFTTPQPIPIPKRKPASNLDFHNTITIASEYRRKKKNLSAVDKYNIEIINNRNWGLNPLYSETPVRMRLPKRSANKMKMKFIK